MWLEVTCWLIRSVLLLFSRRCLLLQLAYFSTLSLGVPAAGLFCCGLCAQQTSVVSPSWRLEITESMLPRSRWDWGLCQGFILSCPDSLPSKTHALWHIYLHIAASQQLPAAHVMYLIDHVHEEAFLSDENLHFSISLWWKPLLQRPLLHLQCDCMGRKLRPDIVHSSGVRWGWLAEKRQCPW